MEQHMHLNTYLHQGSSAFFNVTFSHDNIKNNSNQKFYYTNQREV